MSPDPAAAGADERVIVANVAGETVTFATAAPSGKLDGADPRTYGSDAFPTFAGALERYAQELRLTLQHRALVICVAGAVRGDSIRVTNGRWFISISGLEAMLRRRPVVLNDVSAVAWSTLVLRGADLRPLDGTVPRGGATTERRAVIWVGEGLGAACLGFDAVGRPFTLDSEGGHMTCALGTADERALLDPVAKRLGHVSYERALTHLAQAANQADSQTPIDTVIAGVFGCFAGDVTLAFGAWGGVYLAGPAILSMLRPGCTGVFRERFNAKGRFRGALASVPIWMIEGPDPTLRGAAAFLEAQKGTHGFA